MKTITGWFFSKEDKLLHGDNRTIKIGITHRVKGEIIPCQHGLHLSPKILDALKFAPGAIIYKVRGSGTIIPHGNPIDKYACSERTYIARIDATEILKKFARLCALDAIHLWDAPDVVISFLKTGKGEFRDAAWCAANAAQDAVNTARNAADTAWYAANTAQYAAQYTADAAWDAANTARNAADAAWYAANAEWYAADDARHAANAARNAADAADAARYAANAAWNASDAAQTKQNKRLTGMINRAIK